MNLLLIFELIDLIIELLFDFYFIFIFCQGGIFEWFPYGDSVTDRLSVKDAELNRLKSIDLQQKQVIYNCHLLF